MTPHISSEKESIARVVIMPGDPKRVEYIAKNFLDNPVLVNDVRKETAYTGFYKGKKVTVFSSGMGIPSMGIYSYELFKFYDVKAIIRIGSAGSYVKDLNVNDLFLVDESYSTSSYRKDFIKDNKNIVNAIGFNLGSLASEYKIDDKIDVVGNLEINSFNGVDNIQINIKDLMKSL